MTKKRFFIFTVLLFSFLPMVDCSDTGPVCGDQVCSSDEVCENGECVLGIFIEGGPREGFAGECLVDEDCPPGEVCTEEESSPPNLCTPTVDCLTDDDCQRGLHCGSGAFCR